MVHLCRRYGFILSDEEIGVGVGRLMAWPFFEIRCYVWFVWSFEVTRKYQESTGVNRRTSSSIELSFTVWEFLVMNCSRLPQCTAVGNTWKRRNSLDNYIECIVLSSLFFSIRKTTARFLRCLFLSYVTTVVEWLLFVTWRGLRRE
jgi:hypothetical protein